MTQDVQAKPSTVESQLQRNGKVSYLEIPARDVQRSAAFYEAVFRWNIRVNGERRSFTDPSGDMIGAFETSLAVASEPGLMAYIYVDRIDDTLAKITASGGEVVRAPYPEGGLWVATFRDPAGNLLGVWQAGPR